MTSIFLFAHQDDECAVFQKIYDEMCLGKKVQCLFVTAGENSNRKSAARNSESLRVLGKLGIKFDDIFFVGDELKIIDGDLMNRCNDLARWLENFLINCDYIDSIFMPAWEGGHHDHDALHAISVRVCSKLKIDNICRQFPLYNGKKCKKPFFKVLSPLHENGPVEKIIISWPNRIRFLSFCLQYPSQRITWLGLFMPFMFHFIFKGYQSLQCVSVNRLGHRPHQGPLYYEVRKFTTYKKFSDALDRWLSSYTDQLT